MKALIPFMKIKYNWVPDEQWADLFVMEKLGKRKIHVFNNIMTLRQRKHGQMFQVSGGK